VKKHAKIRAFIAKRAFTAGEPKAQETSGIIHKRNSTVKTEENQAPIDDNHYIQDKMHSTIAAGLLADELPKDLVSKFLEAVEAADVFNGPSTMHAPAAIAPPVALTTPDSPMKEVAAHTSPPRDKKRPLDEPKPAVTPGPSKKGTIMSFFKKQ